MKGIIETSVYLVIFALVCFFSIDFIRINQRVSDAGEISQYIENYIEAYCGDIPDSELSEEARDKKLYVLARSVQKGGMRLTYGDVSRAGDYEYIEYTHWNIRCLRLCLVILRNIHIMDLHVTL